LSFLLPTFIVPVVSLYSLTSLSRSTGHADMFHSYGPDIMPPDHTVQTHACGEHSPWLLAVALGDPWFGLSGHFFLRPVSRSPSAQQIPKSPSIWRWFSNEKMIQPDYINVCKNII
jgi:hypothetical protein